MPDRPQKAVSKETQEGVAQIIDENAEWAENNGHPQDAANYRTQAAEYRAATGQEQKP